jgi:hypothetical protein
MVNDFRDVRKKSEKAQFMQKLGEYERKKLDNKQPFCRACVWMDYEEAEQKANLESRRTNKQVPMKIPRLSDKKYTDFDLVGEREVLEKNKLTNTMMKTGVYKYYKCNNYGHSVKIYHREEDKKEITIS